MLRYLDGVASAADVARLASRLRTSAVERRDVAGLLLQVGALEDLGAARGPAWSAHSLRAVAAPLRPRSRSHTITWMVAGAMVAALIGMVAIVRAPDRRASNPPPGIAPVAASGARARRAPHLVPPPSFADRTVARVESIAGSAFATGEGRRQRLHPGSALGAGDGVETAGPDARVTLALADGARLELRGDALATRLSSDRDPDRVQAPVRVRLERGTAVVSLPARPERMTLLLTPLAEIRVRGGEAHLAVEPELTRVRLRSGVAEVQRLLDGQRFALEAGQSAVVSQTSALNAVEGARALLVRGSDARGAELDRLISARLAAEGFAVRAVDEGALVAGDLAGHALVVISSTSAGGVLAARLPATGLRELAIPVVNCESMAFIPLGMATRQGVGPENTQLFIEQPAHPLAGGKTGDVRMATAPLGATWGLPASGAIRVGTLYGRRRVAVFGYERGAQMIGLAAPARRVSCFLDPKRTGALTEDAWELFDAAVRWAVGS